MLTYSIDTLQQLASAGNEFYASLFCDYRKHGGLTAAQIAHLQERPLAAAPMPQAGVQVDASHLERAFAHAKAKGVRQPSVTLHGYRFMAADPERAQPANRDAIFVTSTTRGEPYLGKVLRGAFLKSHLCTDALARSIGDAVDNPYQAATEFGHATGQCSVCMRPLTNPESVKMGIGPVCRAKFGW
jgi:Family of unknown function (DUF6011)